MLVKVKETSYGSGYSDAELLEVLEPEVLEPEVLELGQSKHCACGHPFEPTAYEIPQRQFVGTTSCGQELLELGAELLEPLELLELSRHTPLVLHIICPSTMPKLLLALFNVASPPTTPVEVSSELFALVPLNVALPETTPKLEE